MGESASDKFHPQIGAQVSAFNAQALSFLGYAALPPSSNPSLRNSLSYS